MNRRPTRLGIYCPGTGTGGPWRYVHSILAGIDLDEFDVSVFCDMTDGYSPRPGVRIVPLSGTEPTSTLQQATTVAEPRKRGPGSLLPRPLRVWAGFARDAARLARTFRRHPVDLLHTQCTGCEESPVAARLAGIPRVLGTFHVGSSLDLHRLRSGPTHRVLEHLSNRCLDLGVAVSRATRADWLQRTHVSPARMVTIHNGIDPAKFCRRVSREAARQELGIPVDRVVVGSVGRLDDAKGYGDLIAAAALLKGEFPALEIVIAGSGPLAAHLAELAERCGVADVVRFLGFRQDVQAVLDSLDVFAFPSWSEALPYALLEAMATGLPAVGSTVGGIPEVIDQDVTGLLISPRNPERLAVALAELIRSPDLRARMGAAGRQRVETAFDERDMVQNTIGLYRNHRLSNAGRVRQ